MGRSEGGGKGSINSEINVTPLVDVVLVLLIIFMVVTPLLQRGFDLDVPQAVALPTPTLSRQIIVTYTKNGEFYINNDRTTREQLEPRLSGILAGQSKKVVFLSAARNMLYGDVVGLMDAIRAAGASSIGMVSDDRIADTPLGGPAGL